VTESPARGRVLALTLVAAALASGPVAAWQSAGATSPARAAADTTGQVRSIGAVVEQVAGATLYLRAGTSEGLAAGDTVAVARDSAGALVGRVSVIASTAARSVVTFAGSAFPVTRGQTLYLRVGAPAVAAANESGRSPDAETGRSPATRVSGSAAGVPAAPPGPTASGRVSLDFDFRRSTTSFGGRDGVSIKRTFATPSLWLETTVRDLPGGFTFEADGRVEQRLSDPSIVHPNTAPEIYEASLSRSFEAVPLDLRLGRFYSPFDPLGGYWDGLMLHYGRTVGGGVEVGFEPNRANQAPQTEMPKASAFLDVRSGSAGSLGYDGDLSLTAMRPSASSGLADHTFATVSQRLRFGRWYLMQDAQVDRSGAGSGWDLTRARLWASGPVNDFLSVRGGVSRYRPYLYWLADSVLISYRRDEVSGGFGARFRGGSFGADVGLDHDQGLGTGHTYSSYLDLRHLPLFDLGLDASGSWFTNGQTRMLTGSARFSKYFGAADAHLGYLLYRSETSRGLWLMSHAIEAGLDVPLSRGLRYSILGQFRIGGGLGETRLYTSLSTSFGP